MAIYKKGPRKKGYEFSNIDAFDNEQFTEAVQAITPTGGGGTVEVLTEYPITDASKAGQEFIYKNFRWSYMTQAEIDSIGWTGLVGVGFPAPLDKTPGGYAPNYVTSATASSTNNYFAVVRFTDYSDYDFLSYGNPTIFRSLRLGAAGASFSIFRNAHLLTGLEDLGTTQALAFINGPISLDSGNVLNQFFTDLPTTTKTATLNISLISDQTGIDPTIATNKGYIVVT